MNVGQILETHLGWAARTLGDRSWAMVAFDGGDGDDLRRRDEGLLRQAMRPTSSIR